MIVEQFQGNYLKSSQTNKSSDVQRDEQIFRRTDRLFVPLERRFFPDDLPDETNKSMTVGHKFTSDRQLPGDLLVLWCENGHFSVVV